ncbi:hypothetical protein VDGE_30510 [Verticillium dahliae]|uniref:Uncharacterized protein n=1 Tax=Verticillium dahliae TaxID=27337 RepID=A0A444RT03_VERDA|nr:hypothetical protein VDGE_30510 [Verticillium dahliae]
MPPNILLANPGALHSVPLTQMFVSQQLSTKQAIPSPQGLSASQASYPLHSPVLNATPDPSTVLPQMQFEPGTSASRPYDPSAPPPVHVPAFGQQASCWLSVMFLVYSSVEFGAALSVAKTTADGPASVRLNGVGAWWSARQACLRSAWAPP